MVEVVVVVVDVVRGDISHRVAGGVVVDVVVVLGVVGEYFLGGRVCLIDDPSG